MRKVTIKTGKRLTRRLKIRLLILMKFLRTYLGVVLLAAIVFAGCSTQNRDQTPANTSEANVNPRRSEVNSDKPKNDADREDKRIVDFDSEEHTATPKTVTEFFNLLPEVYFSIESCNKTTDRNCEKAKSDYLERYKTIEDIENGYLEAGGDGAQATFKMAIFRRPDASYLVGLNVFGEAEDSYRFLNFDNGKWEDVSIEVIPEFSRTNIYELPRKGTTIRVFAKRIIEQGENFEVSEKGEKIYELEWKEGEFLIKR